ncbi:MAG TPA: PAS domain-containing sensor histidine kinase [Cytophagales bacterium]|nr:PAS domain-containing sensor histidine kinase [Cytophagales bacterium]
MNETNFKFELFFELSPDLLCIAGFDGYFKKINPAVSNLFGYTMEELYARPINDFVYEDDKEITAKLRKELTRSKPLLNFENRYVTKKGEIVWLSWTSLPIESDQLVFAIAKNITHKKKQEEERNALLADLTKINKDLRQMNYTTTHDLRSPVNNLLSVLELIETSKVNDEETVELLEILKLAGVKLKRSLNTYVDALGEKNSLSANVEELDLNECLSYVLQSISSLIKSSNVTLHADFSKLGKIKFNKVYLESVFLNFITNSIKYAKPDCLPVISIHSEKINGIDQLIFADNGLGFDMEKVKDKIFGLNQKFHDHADSKGIGLYLVYNHITSLGGKINVESKINEGTKFIISFKG